MVPRFATNESQIGFKGFAFAADRRADTVICRLHNLANAVAQMPCGFHAAIQHPLKLARRYAFLRRAKQMDCLKPHPQRKVAILKNRTLAHRKGGTTAGVALAQADNLDALRMLHTRLGVNALQAANLFRQRTAMRTNRAFRPNLGFDVIESGFFAKEPRIGKDGLGHG